MTLDEFNSWSHEARLRLVSECGTYLASRWEPVDLVILLYHLPGELFAELCYHADTNEVREVRSFVGGEQLADYTEFLAMPEGFDELNAL